MLEVDPDLSMLNLALNNLSSLVTVMVGVLYAIIVAKSLNFVRFEIFSDIVLRWVVLINAVYFGERNGIKRYGRRPPSGGMQPVLTLG